MRCFYVLATSFLLGALACSSNTDTTGTQDASSDGGANGADAGSSADAGLTDGGPNVVTDAQVAEAGAPFTGTDILLYRGGGGVSGNEWDFTNWQGSVSGRTVVDSSDALPALDRFALVMLVAPGAGNSGAGLAASEMTAITAWVKSGGTLLFDTDIDDVYGGFDLSQANAYITSALASLGVNISVAGPVQTGSGFFLPLDGSNPLGAGVGSLSCGDATTLTIGAGATRVDTLGTGTTAYYASAPLGSGRVAVIADTTCIIDYSTSAGTTTTLGTFLGDLLAR